MPIRQQDADKLLADCGRRCCICRRFKPLHLQVHHILPHEEGGSDEPENLIALCVTCHSSVHTKTSMTRNFTAAELRQHRDNTIAAVRVGRLVENSEPPETLEVILKGLPRTNFPAITQHAALREQLLPEAVEVLLAAVKYGGRLIEIKHDGGWILQCTSDCFIPKHGEALIQMAQFGNGADHRTQASYRKAFAQLVSAGLLERAYDNVLDVSYNGYLLADQLIAAEQLSTAQSGTAT